MEKQRENMAETVAAADPARYSADPGLYPADPGPRNAIFHDVISRDAISLDIISHDVISCNGISCGVISRDVISCDAISCDVISGGAIHPFSRDVIPPRTPADPPRIPPALAPPSELAS